MRSTTRFDGRTVMILGASGGFGPNLARAFADDGADLVLAARRAEALTEIVRSQELDDKRVLTHPADAGDQASVDRLVAAAVERFGRIDALVDLVGGFRSGAPVHTTSDAEWDSMVALNVRPLLTVTRAVAPVMLAAGCGAIVAVASPLGAHAAAGTGPYAAAKAAVLRLTEAMAAELGPRGVRVNTVVPATIDTAANRAAMPDADRSSWVAPEDLAAAICWLASDEARGVNGAALPIVGARP